MITGQQQAHFDVFGFLAIRQLLSPDEVAVITCELEAALLEDRDGKPFDGKTRQSVSDWFRERPAVEFLGDDPRIHKVIEQLLGPSYLFLDGNDGNFFVGDTGWHPDMGWDPHIPQGRNDPNRINGPKRNHYVPSIKVAFYLDTVDKETGCLRVIPGTHQNPYHDRLWSLHLDIPATVKNMPSVRPQLLEMWQRDTGSSEGGEQFLSEPGINHFGVDPRDVPIFAIESQPGDVVFFSHQLWHASFGGRVGRRMFTLNFRSEESGEDGEPSREAG